VPPINISSAVTISATFRPIDVGERAGPDDFLTVTLATEPNLRRRTGLPGK
jgi:hypothetical protein